MAHQPPDPDRPAVEQPAAKSTPAPRDSAHDRDREVAELPEPVDPWADTDATPWLFGAAPAVDATQHRPHPSDDRKLPDAPQPQDGPQPEASADAGPERDDPTRRYATPSPTRAFPAPPPTRSFPAAPPAGPTGGPAAHGTSPAAPPQSRPVPAAPPQSRPVPAAPAPAARPPATSRPPMTTPPAAPPPARPPARPPALPAQPGPLPVAKPPRAPRRRRRWPLRLLLATVLSLACCCGVPAYYLQPAWTQYPAAVELREEVADLRLREDAGSEKAAEELANEMLGAHLLAEEAFAGIYRTGGGKQVTIFGSTGFRFTPESDADEEIARLTDRYRITDVRELETGERGAHLRCGTGRDAGQSVVVCTWADHGSLGTGLFTQLSVEDSARLLARFREQLIVRG